MSSFQYRPLAEEVNDLDLDEKSATAVSGRKASIKRFASYAACCLCAFVLGRVLPQIPSDGPMVPLSAQARTFILNSTFGAQPSPETDAAWAALFPIQGGFFKHPEIAPERSAFSVFHTLHCVDGLRHGYYILYDALLHGQALNMSDLPFHASPEHAQHCLDLLRQNIMCQPDLTVEVVDEDIGGVTGFGTEHQCRDWSQLLSWMSHWEGWQHVPKHNHTDMESGGHKGVHGHGHGRETEKGAE